MVEKFFFLSGLPRSGSTLLSALISQNPDIHAEGNSALCQMMWDSQQSCRTTAYEQLAATGRFEAMQGMVCATLPHMYYDGVQAKYVLDKCRSWTLPDNMQMVSDYITKEPKVIVLVRSIEDIVRSFMQLRIDNGQGSFNPNDMLADWSEPIMRSYNGAIYAKENNNGRFLFVDYDSFVANPEKQLARLYGFLDLPVFVHSFTDVENKHPENDAVYGLLGQHDVRAEVKKRDLAYKLPEDVAVLCKDLTIKLYEGLDLGE